MSQYSDFKVDLNNANSTWTKVFNLVKPNSVVLDIGCSSGYFDNELVTKMNCTVDGFELYESDAEKASKVCRKVTNENIEDYIFNNDDHDIYDYILFLDVLEHLIDPVKTLQKCKKIHKYYLESEKQRQILLDENTKIKNIIKKLIFYGYTKLLKS